MSTSSNRYIVEPFLHYSDHAVYNPITNLSLTDSEPLFAALRDFSLTLKTQESQSAAQVADLATPGWIIPETAPVSSRYRLKSVQIELHTLCNHSCAFCPVSIARRSKYVMPVGLFESILNQLQEFRETLQGVWLHNYNEPTLDPRLPSMVKLVWERGLRPCINSNASGLSESTVSALQNAGGLQSLSINLSTLDPQRYAEQRGVNQLNQVRANLERLKSVQLAPRMNIVVIGNGDDQEEKDFNQISEFFKGSLFTVNHYPHNNRAGALPTGRCGDASEELLGGCDFLGSRPLQHLTIDAYGGVVLCCQDYYSKYGAGNVAIEQLTSILSGVKMQQLRSQVYGLLPAPRDFICRSCPFVLRGTGAR